MNGNTFSIFIYEIMCAYCIVSVFHSHKVYGKFASELNRAELNVTRKWVIQLKTYNKYIKVNQFIHGFRFIQVAI